MIIKNNTTGASMVEIALVLPIFLICVYLFIWLALVRNEISSFTSAVEYGVRLASTRGNKILMGFDPLQETGLIPALEQTNFDPNSQAVLDLIASQDLRNSATSTYNTWYQNNLNASLQDLPKEYLYTLTFISQAMLKSIGTSVRFPCDPADPNNNDPKLGYSCLKCIFFNPADSDGSTVVNDLEELKKGIAISCQYAPAGLIPKLISGLLNIFNPYSTPNKLIFNRSSIIIH